MVARLTGDEQQELSVEVGLRGCFAKNALRANMDGSFRGAGIRGHEHSTSGIQQPAVLDRYPGGLGTRAGTGFADSAGQVVAHGAF